MLLHFCKTADCCLNVNFFVLSLQLFYVKNYFMFQNNLYSSFNFKTVQVYMFYYSVAFHVAVISFLM